MSSAQGVCDDMWTRQDSCEQMRYHQLHLYQFTFRCLNNEIHIRLFACNVLSDLQLQTENAIVSLASTELWTRPYAVFVMFM